MCGLPKKSDAVALTCIAGQCIADGLLLRRRVGMLVQDRTYCHKRRTAHVCELPHKQKALASRRQCVHLYETTSDASKFRDPAEGSTFHGTWREGGQSTTSSPSKFSLFLSGVSSATPAIKLI